MYCIETEEVDDDIDDIDIDTLFFLYDHHFKVSFL
jgi:hypothetical protein